MDWNEILGQAMAIIVPALATLIATFFAYLGNKLKNAYQEKVNNETAQAVVRDVVQFVEQVYKDAGGPEKLQKAITETSTILQSKGIKITETEIKMLIESAVYGLKEGFNGEDIEKALKDTQEEVKVLNETVAKLSLPQPEIVTVVEEDKDENVG